MQKLSNVTFVLLSESKVEIPNRKTERDVIYKGKVEDKMGNIQHFINYIMGQENLLIIQRRVKKLNLNF